MEARNLSDHDNAHIAKLAEEVASLKLKVDQALTQKVDALQAKIDQNTVITVQNSLVAAQVLDILTSFRVISNVAKWLTAIGAFGLMMYHVWQKLTGK